ncbi:MAG: glycerol kinase GlpK [Deinococcaceae bacterium]
MKYLLALDQGTTSSRALLFNQFGEVIGKSQIGTQSLFPKMGWVEQDPEDIWRTQLESLQTVVLESRVDLGDIEGLGIANQRETTVVWERKTGKPIYNAIVWQDRRTATLCEQLKAKGLETTLQAKTGLCLDPYFSATKINWILENVTHAKQLAEAGDLLFGTIDTWLLWKLTEGAVHATDPTNASRTLLFDIHTQTWDETLLNIFEIPKTMLPEVRPSSSVYGYTSEAILGRRVPIAGMAGDQQAAAFGQNCVHPGMAKNTYGTGCFALLHTGTNAVASKHRLLTTLGCTVDGRASYHLEGSMFTAGASIEWLRDGLKLVSSANEVEKLANSVPDAGGVYLVPGFTGLGAPYWDPLARGALMGLGRETRPGHIARATLEAMAYQVYDVFQAMKADTQMPLTELRVDGGVSKSDTLMQFQADLLGIPIVRPRMTEVTAVGAVRLAGLALGVWNATDEAQPIDRIFEPKMDESERQPLLLGWQKAIQRSMNWLEEGQP